MIVSDEYKFLYFPPVKTGTQSIWHLLEKKYNAYILGIEDEFKREAFGVRKEPKIHQMFFLEKHKDYTTFISVRNPYDRFISIFNYFIRKKPYEKIENYMKPELKVKSISEQLYGDLMPNCIPIRLDYIIKLESIEEDFNKLPFLKQKESLPVENISVKKVTKLTTELEVFVENKFALDFINFNYQTKKKIKLC